MRVARCGRTLSVVLVLLFATACSESPTNPSTGAIVTFQVVDETFRVRLTTPQQIDAARQAQAGGPAKIPNGRIITGTDVNTGWSWHLEDVSFAEVTVEVCDGRPSDVQREGTNFGGGRYCPWQAVVVRIDQQ